MLKRVLSLALAVMIAFSVLSASSYADGTGEPEIYLAFNRSGAQLMDVRLRETTTVNLYLVGSETVGKETVNIGQVSFAIEVDGETFEFKNFVSPPDVIAGYNPGANEVAVTSITERAYTIGDPILTFEVTPNPGTAKEEHEMKIKMSKFGKTAVDGGGEYTSLDTTDGEEEYLAFQVIDPYGVTYYANGGTGGDVPVDEALYEVGALVTVMQSPKPTRDHYDFIGWGRTHDAGENDVVPNSVPMEEGGLEFYAIWKEHTKYKVFYDINDGDLVPPVPVDGNEYYEGDDVHVSAAVGFTKANHIFLGWSRNENATTEDEKVQSPFRMGTENVTLYAIWQECDKFPVRYHAPDATGGEVPEDLNTYYEGDTVSIKTEPAPTREHYDFLGWARTPDAVEPETEFVMGNIEVSLYAIWREHPKYTLTFEVNGGSEVESVTEYVNTEIDLSGYVPTRKSHTFEGWYSDSGLNYAVSQITLTENRTVYAKWKLDSGVNNEGIEGLIEDNSVTYIKGSNGAVNADKNMTRAEVAQMFYNLLIDKEKGDKTASFTDVKGNAWYYTAITVLASRGILSGYPDGTFNPEGNITRAEFLAITGRFGYLLGGTVSFNDVGGHWAIDYIINATVRGWVDGYPDGGFRPQRNITRAEAIKITNAILERIPDKDAMNANPNINPFYDLKNTHWAYYEILAAAVGIQE